MKSFYLGLATFDTTQLLPTDNESKIEYYLIILRTAAYGFSSFNDFMKAWMASFCLVDITGSSCEIS